MTQVTNTAFEVEVWQTALEAFGRVAQLSVILCDADEVVIGGPVPATPIVAMFQEHGYDPEVFSQCARACLAQPLDHRAPVVVTSKSGLADVGVSLLLDGRVVGAVVGGYALIGFSDSIAMARLARQSGIPFQELWDVTRVQRPLPAGRLTQFGELLQVLADTLLRENDLKRRSENAGLLLSHQASHDPLTDLPNRPLLAERLADALALARRHERQLAVLYLDINHFKSINDSLGHHVGDELLRSIAHDVTSCVRASDTVSRLGGDEFVVVLAELRHPEDAAVAAQHIAASLGRPRTLAGHEIRTTLRAS